MAGWQSKGVYLPEGTKLRMAHGYRFRDAEIRDGRIVVGEHAEGTLSAAARRVTGKSENGWQCWCCKRPGDVCWIPMDWLRVPSYAAGVGDG